MNIKKYMNEHEFYIKEQLLLKGNNPDWNNLKEKHERMIRYMQHERLIHLLVTLAVGVFLLITIRMILTLSYPQLIILAGLFLILLAPYLFHYFIIDSTSKTKEGYAGRFVSTVIPFR